MDFAEQLEGLRTKGRFTIFEIPVKTKVGNESGFLVCDIYTDEENNIGCCRDALTTAELESDFIPYTRIEIDSDFSLDEHLQELYSKVIEEICNSEFYYLDGMC